MNVLDFNGRVIGHLDDAGNFLPETQVSQVPHPSPITHSPIKDTPIQTTYTPVDIVDASRATKNHSGFLSQDLPYTAKDLAPATRASQVTCDTGVSGPATQVSQVNAVTGDELDDLVLACAAAFMRFPRLQKHIDHTLMTSDGRYPKDLLDEVTVWIQQGDLRSPQQVNVAVSAFCDYMERLVALSVFDSKWAISVFAPHRVSQFRIYFKVPDAKPLPSKTEILAAAERAKREHAERSQQQANDSRRMKREVELYERVLAIVDSVAKAFWSYDGVDLNADEITPRLRFNSGQRRAFRKFQKDYVTQLVSAGKSDAEVIQILEENFMLIAATVSGENEWGSIVPCPLQAGERREYFEPEDYMSGLTWALSEMKAGEKIVISLCMDGRFVFTVGPEGEVNE